MKAANLGATPETFKARPCGPLTGRVRPPGDKSISHRALILGALAHGVTEIEGLLEGEDVLRTAAAVAAFGAGVEHLGPGRWRVGGQGGFAQPAELIDCGNAGTGVRLLMGAAAGFPIQTTFDGDSSLRKRPMGRVTGPLERMGARFETQPGGRLPLILSGGSLQGIEYRLPMASAQVKSAVLLAGLNAEGDTVVIEPEPTRDHTERMLKAFGADLAITEVDGERHIRVRRAELEAASVAVPGDPSSAAFPLVAALIVPGSAIEIEHVLLNPSRIGLIAVLQAMGGDIEIHNRRDAGGEPVGDLTVRASRLTGVVAPPDNAAAMIDEYPILAVAAAFAEGETIMRGIGEMRVKESDRIALMAQGLAACGVTVREEPDGLIVVGTGQPPAGGARVTTHGDHRIAMAHLVLGLAAQAPVEVDEPGMIATSFPGFVELMASLGAEIDAG
jgi:3-phosphoshikimate 1-carboxyvinyltransferase